MCLRISHDEVEDGDYFTDTLGFRIFDVSQIIRKFCKKVSHSNKNCWSISGKVLHDKTETLDFNVESQKNNSYLPYDGNGTSKIMKSAELETIMLSEQIAGFIKVEKMMKRLWRTSSSLVVMVAVIISIFVVCFGLIIAFNFCCCYKANAELLIY